MVEHIRHGPPTRRSGRAPSANGSAIWGAWRSLLVDQDCCRGFHTAKGRRVADSEPHQLATRRSPGVTGRSEGNRCRSPWLCVASSPGGYTVERSPRQHPAMAASVTGSPAILVWTMTGSVPRPRFGTVQDAPVVPEYEVADRPVVGV